MSDELEEASAEASAARLRLADSIDEVQQRLRPRGLLDETLGALRRAGGRELLDEAVAAARRNPLPLLLAGAGLAWFAYELAHGAPARPAPGEKRRAAEAEDDEVHDDLDDVLKEDPR